VVVQRMVVLVVALWLIVDLSSMLLVHCALRILDAVEPFKILVLFHAGSIWHSYAIVSSPATMPIGMR